MTPINTKIVVLPFKKIRKEQQGLQFGNNCTLTMFTLWNLLFVERSMVPIT